MIVSHKKIFLYSVGNLYSYSRITVILCVYFVLRKSINIIIIIIKRSDVRNYIIVYVSIDKN